MQNLEKNCGYPTFAITPSRLDRPGNVEVENVPPLGGFLRDVMKCNMDDFRVFAPDENTSNKLDAHLPGLEEILDR